MSRSRVLVAVAALAAVALALVWWSRGDDAGPATSPPGTARAGGADNRAGVEMPTLDHLPAQTLQYDDDPVGDHRLEGQVVDADEQPVAGATVVIDANPPREVQTESDGSFGFDLLTPRTYRIEARSGDGVAGPVGVRLSASSDPVVLRLREAARVGIDVRRADDDRPIAGAMVELRHLASVSAVSDDTGRAVLRGVGGGWHVVKVSSAGFAAAFVEVTSTGEPGQLTEVTVRLRAGVSVAGTVVDSSGTPVEGARVVADGASRAYQRSDPRLDGVVTDAKGRWRLTGLPQESLRFRAYDARYAPGVTAPMPLGDGGDRDGVVIVLERGARIRGRVVDAAGAAVPGAEVRVADDRHTSRSGLVRRAACDASGRFEMVGLARRVVRLMAMADGASSPVLTLDLAAAGEPGDVELRVEQVTAIAGTVVTSSGQPVAEARVVAEPVSGDDRLEWISARLRGSISAVADADGRFQLGGLAPGPYLIRAVSPGAPSELLAMRAGVRVEAGARDARVVVDDLASVTGRVAFADGSAPAEIAIELGSAPPRWSSDPAGAFRIEGVPSGKQFIRIDGPDLVSETLTEVEIRADKINDLGTITVQRGRRISGLVVDEQGRPVAGAAVVVTRQLDADGSTLTIEARPELEQVATGADGRFAVRGIGVGVQTVVADHDAVGRSAALEVAPGAADAEVTLTLRPTGAVQGFVRFRGQPADAVIVLRPVTAANAAFEVRTGPDGSYRHDRIAAGKYLLWAGTIRGTRHGGSDGVSRLIEVIGGEVLDADVDIDPGGITLVVRLASPGDVVGYGYAAVALLDAIPEPMPRTIGEARALLTAAGDSESREGLIVKDRQIELQSIRPGLQGVCAAPLRGDPADPAVIAELQGNIVDWPIYCTVLEVTPSPARQEVTVTVQPLP